VMMCADGGLFVFHDVTLERTTNGQGEFGAATSDYIGSLDAGSWFAERFYGEKIPSLAEALRWLLAHQVQANNELKPQPGHVEETTTAFLTCLKRYWPSTAPLPLVSCFDAEVLRLCARLSPELPLGLLFLKWKKDWITLAKEVHATSVHLNQFIATRRRIHAIKNAGYEAYVYTINSRDWAARYQAWGADAILSDYPDLMIE
jgi:glycerophosphoryl diester phosphodiesterase